MPKHKNKKSSVVTAVVSMVDISLNCRLFRDIEENYEFTITANTANTIENFKKDIKKKIKEAGNNIFTDIEADHLMLWKVWIPNGDKEKFLDLTLDKKNKNVNKLEGIVGNHWAEQPLKEVTHVIVDSPYLTVLRKLNNLTNNLMTSSQESTDGVSSGGEARSSLASNISLQHLYHEQYIKQGNILLYDRTYENVKFTYKCKIKGIYKAKKLLVTIPSANEKEMLFDDLSELELYILKKLDTRFKNTSWVTGCAYNWFFIIDEGVNKGNISELSIQYVKDKTTDLTEENVAKKLEHDYFPVLDPVRCKMINKARDEFRMKFKKKVPFSYVCEALVDDKESIIAFVDLLEGSPVQLPAKFRGYPIFISYKAFEFHHRSFHKDLMPGISIGNSDLVLTPNASTLGVLFKNSEEPNKAYILTAKHGMGNKGDEVVQPGTLENVTKYNFIGADEKRRYFDYAFCETVRDREIPQTPNVPIGNNIQIRSIKSSISNTDDLVYVKKVGRTTYLTEGLVKDMLEPFYPPIVKKKNKRAPKERPERLGMRVYGINNQVFGDYGDSGAPVFDNNGQLWGIYIGAVDRISFLIPINLILDDVKKRFNGAEFTLIKEEELEREIHSH